MAKLECHICGKRYNEEEMQILNNRNLACHKCVQNENSHKDEKEAKK